MNILAGISTADNGCFVWAFISSPHWYAYRLLVMAGDARMLHGQLHIWLFHGVVEGEKANRADFIFLQPAAPLRRMHSSGEVMPPVFTTHIFSLPINHEHALTRDDETRWHRDEHGHLPAVIEAVWRTALDRFYSHSEWPKMLLLTCHLDEYFITLIRNGLRGDYLLACAHHLS